jgi:hypothetical protein|tara:strand:+ start:207 stop:422 length:216 start_codon:yes stop_codon:yes gene_type:complete
MVNLEGKLSEMLIATLALVTAFITKRIFKNTDTLSDRVSGLELRMLTKKDISKLEDDVSMIVTHLITKGKK